MGLPTFVTVNEAGFPQIAIGRMRHLITVQSLGPSSPPVYDSAGQVSSWNTFTTGYAAIGGQAAGNKGGTDVIRDGQQVSQAFLTVAMWYQPGIAANMRVVSDNGATYVIQSIENVLELDVVLVLTCLAIGGNDQ